MRQMRNHESIQKIQNLNKHNKLIFNTYLFLIILSNRHEEIFNDDSGGFCSF
jgi:hypothetical protein